MNLNTIWDRASDSSIDNWLIAKIEIDREFFQSVKDKTDTSLGRVEFRDLMLAHFRSYENLVHIYEHFAENDVNWYLVVEFEDWAANVTFYGRTVYFEVSSKNITLSKKIIQ